MLEINQVSKQYAREKWALKAINLQVTTGIIGLLGPNGAGKSSLMRILATISQPTEGTVRWDGVDIRRKPDELRRVLGYLPQDFGVYPNLNAVEFLEYAAALKGLGGHKVRARIMELLELLNLHQVWKSPVGTYSGGMRQRLGIAQALLNDPRLLIIDEPTVGLDPEERMRFRSLLTDLSGERIVIFSTHIVSDIEATADRIAVLSRGELLVNADPAVILRRAQGKVWSVVIPDQQLQEARANWTISGTVRREEGLQLRVVSDVCPHPRATELAPSLEDAYLYVKAAREGA
ncbi:ABC transporter ATP-binding protein [Paenibacillus sp. CCS19]|uniref:ABC transporter ATP-binding protein n=1 Tax=Paenibacillus sp. CCS19 TaxID=3158387 RepID=UPI002569E26B|nr:ABC transporter ATP-binding protein [Paenibacillus cellulosilyticus]GMK42653.1 ABC transporter ATP-binding protein [Paenibacillus cellulosilyticus]